MLVRGNQLHQLQMDWIVSDRFTFAPFLHSSLIYASRCIHLLRMDILCISDAHLLDISMDIQLNIVLLALLWIFE